jgi:hypothetical protein
MPMHFLCVGGYTIPSSRVVYMHADPIAVGLAIIGGELLEWPAESPEAEAVRWWFLSADRQDCLAYPPGRTIDLVAAHERAVRMASIPTIPGLARLPFVPAPEGRPVIGPVCCRMSDARPAVAEAVCETPGGAA